MGGGGGSSMGGGSAMGGGTALGSGNIKDLTAAATAGSDFHLPLDAALSPDGKTAYFAAVNATGDAAIFKASATTPAAATVLAFGDPLASPFGLDVSTDGTTLVVADSAALDSAGLDHGCLFSLSASTAGTPAIARRRHRLPAARRRHRERVERRRRLLHGPRRRRPTSRPVQDRAHGRHGDAWCSRALRSHDPSGSRSRPTARSTGRRDGPDRPRAAHQGRRPAPRACCSPT